MLQVVFLYASSDSSNAFRMFLLLLEFSLGPDPCDEDCPLPPSSNFRPSTQAGRSTEEMVALSSENVVLGFDRVAAAEWSALPPPDERASPRGSSLLMGLPRNQGGLYFTAGLLTSITQKSANLAALFLSFVIIGAGDSVRVWSGRENWL